MKTFRALALGALITFGSIGCTSGYGGVANKKPVEERAAATARKTMRAFNSESELRNYLQELSEKQRQERARAYNGIVGAAPAAKMSASHAAVADDKQAESITNVQHAGVDEGGIVKLHGNHLVALRRGRLFTVSIGGNALDPISSIDAFGPDIDPSGTWYDEMLVSNDTVVVIGYSYARGGTEVGLFDIDDAGKLAYRSTYHLRSNDYYSSRNYASRLIGTKLIFYSPLYLNYGTSDPFASFPAVRKWHKGAKQEEFKRIAAATDVYRPEASINAGYGMALHTVTTCDLANGGFDCKAKSVIGPWGRVFYVSPNAVYVWITAWNYFSQKSRTESMLYRMPLDGSGPSALRVSGSPIDQFSFLESEDGRLNVLIRSDTIGDGMWGAETDAGSVALMTVPIENFSDGSAAVDATKYRKLPRPDSYTFQNRFVGDYLLYGTGSGWGYPVAKRKSSLFAIHWSDGITYKLPLTHGTDRIEQMGSDAVVVGANGNDLHFTSVRLGDSPEIADDYIRKNASQGELRSQGFFYKPDGKESGMLGLPISVAGRPGYGHLFENSAAILFLRNDSLRLEEMGELGAHPELAKTDGCRASCVDWYGNARPLFVYGRVIALLGYELVEGSLDKQGIREMRRTSYAPQSVEALNGRAPEELQNMK